MRLTFDFGKDTEVVSLTARRLVCSKAQVVNPSQSPKPDGASRPSTSPHPFCYSLLVSGLGANARKAGCAESWGRAYRFTAKP